MNQAPVSLGDWIPGRVSLLEASPGAQRQRILRAQVEEARRKGGRTWLLDCSFESGGPWAGIHDLFASLLEEIRQARPELLEKHDYELAHVLPELRRSMRVRYTTLTDLASQEEKVRNYPADRAFRIVHGLIELLDEWKGDDPTPWAVVCDNYDGISHIGRRFFRELMRRRGDRLGLGILAVTAPGRGEEARAGFAEESLGRLVRLDLAGDDEAALDPAQAERLAQELEERVGDDLLEIQIHLPALIRLWDQAGKPRKVFKYNFHGLDIFNTQGFYEDAIVYGERARALFKEHIQGFPDVRWTIFLKLFMSYLGLLDSEGAWRVAQEDAVGQTENLEWRGQLHYLLAMLYARFFPQRDLARGEELLDLGLRDLQQAQMDEETRHFQTVFNRNGLAMIRHFQGRFQEAIDLCREGLERLERHLSPDRHRLHRSVLLYNMAQVYFAVGEHEQALAHYSAAMEMDPNYSEYYNERGNVYLRMGRHEEARADYLRAIELSPPYFEVWTNLGQSCRLLGRMEEASSAYTRALDLQPGQLLALLGRAQAREALGQTRAALADYTAALAIHPDLWDALASRAVLHYEIGELEACLADLDRAIELAPQEPDLYQNRALVLADLGYRERAARDLETYLAMNPAAGDRVEVEDRLRRLEEEWRAIA